VLDCDILPPDLIGLIEYSCQQDIPSFFRNSSVKNSEVKYAWPEAI
jgi:hypothetical protein